MAEKTTSQKRVAIWCVARSLSSVFTRCLSQIPHSYVLFEMFVTAFYCGHGKGGKHLVPDTFEPVKALCEQPWPGKSLILLKDLGYSMGENYLMIPEGYQHVFLIRHPSKAILSFELRLAIMAEEEKECYIGAKLNQFEHLFKMYKYVTQKLGLEATVLDANDLIMNTKQTLQTFCQILGLPFTEQLLSWDRCDGIPDNWMMSQAAWKDHALHGWFDRALQSTCFIKPKDPKKEEEGVIQKARLTPVMKEKIDKAMPYYEALREMCIKP